MAFFAFRAVILNAYRFAGNTAAAAFNAVLGNLLGVVVTPALLLLLLGRRLDMAPSLLATFKKLGIKVRVCDILPALSCCRYSSASVTGVLGIVLLHTFTCACQGLSPRSRRVQCSAKCIQHGNQYLKGRDSAGSHGL